MARGSAGALCSLPPHPREPSQLHIRQVVDKHNPVGDVAGSGERVEAQLHRRSVARATVPAHHPTCTDRGCRYAELCA